MMGKPAVLRHVICSITRDISFANCWISVSSLEIGLNECYKLNQKILISKKNISRAIGKIEPPLDTLSNANSAGIYRGKYKKDAFNIMYVILYISYHQTN